ncbi:MAG: flippase [Cyanobacteria bacterium J06621_15]
MKQSDSLKQRLIREAVGSFGLKIVSTGLALFLNLILARFLGSNGLGSYTLAITLIGLLGLPAKLGFPQLLVREVAVYFSEEKWGLLRGIINRTYQISIALSLTLIIAVVTLTWLFIKDSQIYLTVLLALMALPFSSLRILNQSVMSGLHRVVQGQLPIKLIAPLMMLLLTLSGYATLGSNMAIVFVIACYVGVTAITFLIGYYQLNCVLPREIFITEPEYKTQYWIKVSIPFMVLGALYMVNSQTDIVMLGAIKDSESVGLYVVGNKLASLIIFIFMASKSSLKPNIASLYQAGKLALLESIVKKSSQLVSFSCCIVAAFIFIFKDSLLGLFGQEFLASNNVLILLIMGQLVNILVGPVDILLNMSGKEKLSLIIFSISAVANISLNYYLIPKFGAEGAAIATSISTITWSLSSMILVFKYIGINPTAFGKSKV